MEWEAVQITAYLIAAYLLGAVPFGLVLTRLAAGVDVRRIGSGNIGATNVLRATGKFWAVATLIADVLKAAIPAWLALKLWPGDSTLAAAAGLAAFLGHCFPIYLGFKGGKGVACALGVYFVLSPLAVLIAVAVFVIAVLSTRIVSVGSLSGVLIVVPILAWQGARASVLALTGLMAALVFLRHRSNLGRLVRGQENRLGAKPE